MLIESPEELRKWLTSHLEPMCDADPQALAKYVLALIRKDKSIEELKSSMISQMDVFLQSETNPFVDMLFKIVDTKEYISGAQNTTVSPAPKQEKEPEVEKEKTEAIAAPAESHAEADSTTPVRAEHDKLPEPRPSYDDREERKRRTPPRERLGHGYRGGHRDHRDYNQSRRLPRTSRSRSRSLSPRHDRFRSTRRRSRSPPDMRQRGGHPRRGRSQDRGDRDAGTPTRDENSAPGGYTPTAKPRCRDYEEKGFCLRGDMCKFDHGSDAVVLEDSLGYQPGLPGPGFEQYVPGIPGGPSGISYPPPVMTVPPPGYAPLGVKRGYEGDAGFQPPPKRFDHGRGGPRGRGRGRGRGIGRGFNNMHQSSSMLAVRNIPVEMNSILHLNSHFSKFGTLVNVQIQFEGDPSSALITFAGTSEAAAAYNCTEAVLNNRFIKVFWHVEKQSAKERLGNTNPNNVVLGEKPEEAAAEDTEKVKEEKEKAIQEIQKSQEMLQTKHEEMKKVEEQRKEALVKQEGLLKSKHDLVAGLIEQQKMLISKLEKGRGTMKPEEKTKIMKLLKELTKSIERTKEDIKTSLAVAGTKSKGDIQKELLDTEMELFAKQQEGEDTEELQQRLDSLRIEARRLGIRGRGRGGFRGRGAPRGGSYFSSPRGGVVRGRGRGGRGFPMVSPGSNKLDRRPTSLMVTGFEAGEKEEIVKHFNKFGEVSDMVEDEETPSLIFKFKTRLMAESAMNMGKTLGEKQLGVSWYTKTLPGKEGEEEASQEGIELLDQEEPEDDGYTPPQEDYLPPGLQEHEDSLSRDGAGLSQSATASETAETEELDENLLDDDDEDEEDAERSWKRNSREDEK